MVEHSLICIAEAGLRKDDVGLSALPLYHCAELHANLFPRVQVGATSIIHHEFDPVAVLEAIDEHDVTQLFAAPTAWNGLAQTAPTVDADTSSLRIGFYGASPMPKDVLEKQGSAGLPALNHELRIVEPDADPEATVEQGDIGEILLAGPCTMREYWNRPEATAQSLREHDGVEWYYSGDLGYRDEDGYLYVVDRKDDMIISGGENIYPTEVEDVLFSHPDVVEAAVVGQPHDEWGEVVVAYVVGDTDAETLDAFLQDSDDLADFKRPRAYEFVEELPKNPSGKVQKFKLREE
jgi:acyl-CoA synthetase (AMP-forming)/AMP-acid ligase II